MNLQQAIDQRRQNTENQFYTNLMRYAIHDSPQFDMSGKNPQFIGGKADAMPSKTQLWNQYVAIKGGRMNPQDLMMFEQQYAQIKMAHRNKQMSQLQQLSTRGFSDVKIKNMIKESPVLYQNLLDMITELKGSGDDNAIAQASLVEQYLPQKSRAEDWKEGFEDKPYTTALQAAMIGTGGVATGALGYKAYKAGVGTDTAKKLAKKVEIIWRF